VFGAKRLLDFGSEPRVKHFARTTLTGNRDEAEDEVDREFDLDPMNLEAVRLPF
jgi:hypothetical protein